MFKNKYIVNRLLTFLFTLSLLSTTYTEVKASDDFLEVIQKDNIINYSTKDYLGGQQVWCIEKGEGKDVFAATNKGLSVFDGNIWRNFRTPKHNTSRWLYYDLADQVIYCAADNGFGYWIKNKFGQYEYHSLYRNENTLFSEIFWRVYPKGDMLYFQTQQKIYVYDKISKKTSIVLSVDNINYLYKYKNELYVQVKNQLLKLINGKFEPTGLTVNSRIINLVSLGQKDYIVTEDSGLLEIDNFRLTNTPIAFNNQLIKVRPFSAYQLTKDLIVVGSVLDGAFLINNKLEIKKHFSFQSGLNHTTVLSIGASNNKALWLGLDGGLAEIINRPSEIILSTSKMDIGSVYDAFWFNSHLYLATNKGLFKFEDSGDVSFVDGSQGQIWGLSKIDDRILIICHDAGLFQLDPLSNKLRHVSNDKLWRLIPFDNDPNIFLGLNTGQYFSIYEKKNGSLQFRNKISGLDAANTQARIDRYGHIWVQDRVNKPIKISLDRDFNLETIKTYLSSVKTDSLLLTKIDGDIVFYDRKNAYSYDIAADSLIVNQHYSDLIKEMQFFPRQIEQVDKDAFFYASANQIAYIKRSQNKFYNYGQIFQSIKDHEITSFAHKVIPINNTTVATGIQGGIAIYFMKNQESSYKTLEKLQISQLDLSENNTLRLLPISGDTMHTLSSDYQYLRVYFKNLYPNNLIEYKIGKKGEWILIKGVPYFDVPKLSAGNYDIYFRNADIYNSNNVPECVLRIKVLLPWYLHPVVFALIIIFVLAVIILVRFFFKKRLKQQHKKIIEEQTVLLEKEKKEFDLEILQMRLKEEEKKMISLTMESIKYNSILNEIKSYTQLSKEDGGNNATVNNKLKSIAKSIDFYLKKEDPNNIFEKYFNAIHDGFYDRLSQKHPNLTQNEMKLCAYVKLNLSTKEIATHINIAPSSVEVARYRLRKKMNLESDTNLQEYIQNI